MLGAFFFSAEENLLPADAGAGPEQERLAGVFDIRTLGVEPALRKELVRAVEIRRVVGCRVRHGRHDHLC